MRPLHIGCGSRRPWVHVGSLTARPHATPTDGAPPPPAGIPTCPPLTPVGDALMATLLADPVPADSFIRDALQQAAAAGAAGATGGGRGDETAAALSPARVAAEAELTDIVYALALAAAYVWTDGVLLRASGEDVATPPRPPPAWLPSTAGAVLLPPGAGE